MRFIFSQITFFDSTISIHWNFVAQIRSRPYFSKSWNFVWSWWIFPWTLVIDKNLPWILRVVYDTFFPTSSDNFCMLAFEYLSRPASSFEKFLKLLIDSLFNPAVNPHYVFLGCLSNLNDIFLRGAILN